MRHLRESREEKVTRLEREGKDPRLAFRNRPEEALAELTADGLGLYSFCTESIEDYLPYLNVEGKRCLSVAASGDQVIALLMAGASEVVAFDHVRESKEILELKMQALAHLDWDSCEQFAYGLWDRVFTPRVFAKLCDCAPGGTFSGSRSRAMQAICGFPVGHADAILKRFQIYGYTGYLANKENFDKAKIAVKGALNTGSVSFVYADVRELPGLELGEFDVIVLSNILTAAFETRGTRVVLGGDENTIRYRKPERLQKLAEGLVSSMIWPVASMLSANGKMMASYHYGCEPITHERPTCRNCGIPHINCSCEKTNPFSETLSRRALLNPTTGFVVEEQGWPTIHRELSGEDVAVFIRRS